MNSTEANFYASSSSSKDPFESRGQWQSIEVFTPVNYTAMHDQPTILSSTWSPDEDQSIKPPGESIESESQSLPHTREGSSRTPSGREPVHKWMAFTTETLKSMTAKGPQTHIHGNTQNGNDFLEVPYEAGRSIGEASMAQRAAEWGLVINKENVAGDAQLAERSSEGSKNSLERIVDSMRPSTESTFGFESRFPRVSQELKEALSTLQQTFVVSDATREDCPIMYASAGFFSMTVYLSKEVIDRNWQSLSSGS